MSYGLQLYIMVLDEVYRIVKAVDGFINVVHIDLLLNKESFLVKLITVDHLKVSHDINLLSSNLLLKSFTVKLNSPKFIHVLVACLQSSSQPHSWERDALPSFWVLLLVTKTHSQIKVTLS